MKIRERGIFAAIIVGFVVWLVLLVALIGMVTTTIGEHGLESVVEDIWCGDDGCSEQRRQP